MKTPTPTSSSRHDATTERKAAVDGEPSIAWWRLPIVWMVIAGPAIVVVAGFATLAIAIRFPDPVLVSPPPATAAEMPAIQGRNHAASSKP